MVVISIVAIITIFAIISFDSVRQSSRDNQRKSDLKNISVALGTFYNRFGRYPDQSIACETSLGMGATCPSSGTTWSSTSDLFKQLVTYEKILSKIPVDPINNSEYLYIYAPDMGGEGTPSCPSTPGATSTCRFILQTRLEKDNCIFSITGGYGNPNTIDLKTSDCVIDGITPGGWSTSCCAQ